MVCLLLITWVGCDHKDSTTVAQQQWSYNDGTTVEQQPFWKQTVFADPWCLVCKYRWTAATAYPERSDSSCMCLHYSFFFLLTRIYKIIGPIVRATFDGRLSFI